MNSESDEVTVIKYSTWHPGGGGFLPARIVMWRREGNPEERAYVTHMEVKESKEYTDIDGDNLAFNYGNYDMTYDEAYDNFKERMIRLDVRDTAESSIQELFVKIHRTNKDITVLQALRDITIFQAIRVGCFTDYRDFNTAFVTWEQEIL